MNKNLIYVILFILVLGLCEVQALGQEWDRAAYWDERCRLDGYTLDQVHTTTYREYD